MSLRDDMQRFSAALKAKYRPVFKGEIDREAMRFHALADTARETAEEITGAGRAIAQLTKGKGQ